MGTEKEPLEQTSADAADTTTTSSAPHHGAQPSEPEKASQDGRDDGRTTSSNDARDNTEPRDPEKGEDAGPSGTEEVTTYISGWKLFVVWVPLSLVAFLMLLDISVVATVGCPMELPLRAPARARYRS
jgi:hypothetical protein